jgi:hypothetical protein
LLSVLGDRELHSATDPAQRGLFPGNASESVFALRFPLFISAGRGANRRRERGA